MKMIVAMVMCGVGKLPRVLFQHIYYALGSDPAGDLWFAKDEAYPCPGAFRGVIY